MTSHVSLRENWGQQTEQHCAASPSGIVHSCSASADTAEVQVALAVPSELQRSISSIIYLYCLLSIDYIYRRTARAAYY